MKLLLSVSLFAALFFSPVIADDSRTTTKPSDIPVEAFAQLNDGGQMKMSPDATSIAYFIPFKGRKNIIVQKLDGSDRALIPPIKDADIKWFVWKGDDILLISYRFTEKEMGRTWATSRLVTYNITTQEMKRLITPKSIGNERMGNIGDSIIDMLEDDPEQILLELDNDYDGDTSVFKVNVRTRKRSLYLRSKFGVNNWKVDENHTVRWGTGYRLDQRVARYLNPVTEKWEDVTEKSWYDKDSIYPIKFFNDPRYAYVYAPNERGINGLAKFDMVEGKIVEEIFRHEIVDISGLATSPETGKIIGVYYTEHYPKINFFNKSYEKLYGQINGALGEGWTKIISINLAKKAFLFRHMNSNSPTKIYYLNGETGIFDFVMDANSNLPTDLMSMAQPIKYKARDGLTIHGYLTLPKDKGAKNLPTIIFPHGGPSSRDSMTFDTWAQFFASRGYAVLQPNFRGSSGYGDYFRALGKKQWGGTMQDDVTDGTQWLIDAGIADPKRTCIVGASYGGYAALMGAVKEPDLYKCAISINGVADLPAMISHDKNFVGGKVWSKSIGLEGEKTKSVSPYHQAEKIKIPVLIVHAKDDPVVPYRQGRDMARRLKKLKKPVTYVEVKNGDHSLDTAETRLATFKAMEKFLAKHLD